MEAVAGDSNGSNGAEHMLDSGSPREPLMKKQVWVVSTTTAGEKAAVGLAIAGALASGAVDPSGVPPAHLNANGNGDRTSLPFLRVKKLAPEAILPSRGSAFAAGYDLSSAYETVVPARGKALVKTELSIAIPEGTYARIAPRSGLAWKHSIDVGAGVIDYDYRGPVGVILFNHSDSDFSIKQGDRIAQLILEKICTPDVVEADDLEATARGVGGFGSTGVSVTVTA